MTDTALAAFIEQKAEIDAALAKLTAISADHFGTHPDRIHWGHVGTLGAWAELLKAIAADVDSLAQHTGTEPEAPEPDFEGRWLRNGSPIPGATGPSYTLTEDDEGATIRLGGWHKN